MSVISTYGSNEFSKIGHGPISDIKPSPENDELYRPILENDPEIINLAESIEARGVEQPLIVTADGWIVSGHRRYAASCVAGLDEVPVIRLDKRRSDYTRDEYLTLLREHNRQRVKSVAEVLKEAMVDTTPEDAYEQMIAHREEQLDEPLDGKVEMGAHKRRARISKAKKPMLDAITKVLENRRRFWPISERTVHYALLNDPPLKHASKPDSTYGNDNRSYKSMGELLTRARLVGIVPMHAIADETRPTTTYRTFSDPADFIRRETYGFLKGYWRNVLRTQRRHIELIVEKNTVLPIVKKVASDYAIPITSGRGFSSLPPRRDIVRRFRESGKERLCLIIVSDADPDGEAIAETFARSIRDDFGIYDVEAFKAALTPDQAIERGLPTDLEAKPTSSRTAGFIEKYGDDAVWELEALDPDDLLEMVDETVLGLLDIDLLNAERERETEDAVEINRCRERIRVALSAMEAGE